MKDAQLISNVQKYFPDKAIELSENLKLILDSIDGTIDQIKNKIDFAVTERNFDDVRFFLEMAEGLNKYELEITCIRNRLKNFVYDK